MESDGCFYSTISPLQSTKESVGNELGCDVDSVLGIFVLVGCKLGFELGCCQLVGGKLGFKLVFELGISMGCRLGFELAVELLGISLINELQSKELSIRFFDSSLSGRFSAPI